MIHAHADHTESIGLVAEATRGESYLCAAMGTSRHGSTVAMRGMV